MPASLSPIPVNLDEPSQGTVVRSFHVIREKAGRKLPHSPMVLKAFTADAFAAAGLIGAVAVLKVLFFAAFFHGRLQVIWIQYRLWVFFQGDFILS
jgi:hypothetical protein